MWKYSYFLPMLFSFFEAFTQKIESLNLYADGADLIVSFGLTPQKSIKELYTIDIRSSTDGYQRPVMVKEGQLEEVQPNNSLIYVIDGQKEFAGYQGDINFRVTADLSFAPLRLNTEKIKAKRGKTVYLDWSGGYRNDTYSLELLKHNVNVATLENNTSGKSISWTIPDDNPVGGDYILRLVSGTDRGESVSSPPFAIRRKVPLGLKILPIIVGGGVVGVLGVAGGEPGGGTGDGDDLPGPPDPPGG